jgi:hypothetical protein
MPIARAFFCDIGEKQKAYPSNGHKSSICLLLLIDFESTFAAETTKEKKYADLRVISNFFMFVRSFALCWPVGLRKNQKAGQHFQDSRSKESIKLWWPVKTDVLCAFRIEKVFRSSANKISRRKYCELYERRL